MKKNLINFMPVINVVAFGLLGASFFAGCSTSSTGTTNDLNTLQTAIVPKVDVVTSFYPLYEIAHQIGGEYVSVKNLVPPGAEPHDYELSPKDIASVTESRILFVNGAGLEPWLDKVVPELDMKKTAVINASSLFTNLISGFHEEEEEHEESEQHDSDSHNSSYDPHIWLDPVQYMKEVNAFEEAIAAADPAHKEYYASQAQRYTSELQALDQSYAQGLSQCSTREFVTNHAAFGYLAKRYNLSMIPIAGLSPDAEPSPKVLADLTDLLKEKSVKYILVETLVSPKIAEALAREVSATTLVLNPLEGLTDSEIEQGQNYVTVMRNNLKNLQIAMSCR